MPLHQNQDGTWQWGKSGKKYKKKQDAIKQMKAIFASGYVEKKATLNGYASNDTNNKGPMYMTYTDVYNNLKKIAAALSEEDAMHPGEAGKTPVYTGAGGTTHPVNYLKQPIGKFKGVAKGSPEYKRPGYSLFTPTTQKDINTVKDNIKRVGKGVGFLDYLLFNTKE